MKSFPSTINESRAMYGNGKANAYALTFDIDRLRHGALNLNKSVPVIEEQLKEVNINVANFQAYPGMTKVVHPAEYATVTEDNNSEEDDNKAEKYGNGVAGMFFNKDKDKDNYNKMSASAAQAYLSRKKQTQTEKIYYENPLQLPAEIIALAKDYDWAYRYMVKEFVV